MMLNSQFTKKIPLKYHNYFNGIWKDFYLVGTKECIKKRMLYKMPNSEHFG
ncbi:MAG: hypothetical protein LBF36_04010 [Mycoplasmataceae bacterium]|nr:hypothetical protein [Mycoplasmataceae bacterium]